MAREKLLLNSAACLLSKISKQTINCSLTHIRTSCTDRLITYNCVYLFSRALFYFNMSSEIESPVSKYGRSSEFGGVLDFIQSMISNDTLRKSFDIPHLVMVGRQNMAKTTLINRLIGRYLLPMRRNETANTLQARTTYPIILNLRNGPKTIVEVRCDTCQGIGGEVENPTDDQVEDFLKQVAGHLPKEEGTPISKTPVNVTLQGMILFVYSCFEKGCRKKMCPRQTRKVIWDLINTLFLTL